MSRLLDLSSSAISKRSSSALYIGTQKERGISAITPAASLFSGLFQLTS
jgi:hypothetical protein